MKAIIAPELKLSTDPIVAILEMSAHTWVREDIHDIPALIQSAAFTLFPDNAGRTYLADAALRVYELNKNQTHPSDPDEHWPSGWHKAIQVAEFERRQDKIFGTTCIERLQPRAPAPQTHEWGDTT